MSESTSAIRIVIVEDHHATRKGLESELGIEPDLCVVGVASGLSEGLQLCDSLKPDVVLLDLHLPDSQGPKSLAMSYCRLPNTRIIVYSGDSRSAILQIVLETGVHGYLLKSEPVPVVAAAVRQVMAGQVPVISDELLKQQQNRLTPTEKDLLRMLARGMKYQEIAAQRVTAPETVRKQVDQLLEKLALNSREELIAWAAESGYGTLER